ncbi:MAG: Asp-tRNA(Asn)/Glu-tRNA(Gln) amidotransferase subunit GatC [Nanoarchaeota archaeon]|nr:Asp-tRNA(Asn)/Glu-tRNA(Gln) amidotransferase subunit GatC [Nanoarchaeota archaeon]MBU4124048.1 Asp-tRNA(Asn)/Glu-tRNA(Gln) amidotransferase subunit GatC [Nanoarchaeota archaeon]
MLEKDLIKKLAKISRLNLTEPESKKFEKDIGQILESFKIIEKVDTKKIEPSFQPFEIKNITREDSVEKSLILEDALKNAEQREKNFFKGPRSV